MSGEESFRRFVAERRAALLSTALLLTGDRGSAEDLVQRTLARARRRWWRLDGPGDPAAEVARLLLRGSSGRAARRRGAQVVEDLPATAPPSASPAVADALRGLDPPTRAATVLRWYERRPAAESAPLLGVPEEAARGAADRGRAALLPVLDAVDARDAPFRRPGPVPDDPDDPADPADDERRLHRALAALAEAPGRWRLDDAQAADDARSRVHRDARRLAGALVAAAAVVAVAVPLTRALPDPPPSAPAASVTAAPAPPLPRAAVLVGPPRGSLAGDAAFLDAVRQVGWGAQEAPPPGEREVVLATDTPDGRVALVVGRVDDDFRGVWLTGPAGAPAADLRVRLPRGLGRDRPLSLVLGGPGPATLVVVAARGDRVETSPRLVVGPRGTVGRTYEEAATADGVVVVPVRTTRDGTGVSVRVLREGRTVHRAGVDWPAAGRGGTAPVPVPEVLRPTAAPPDERLAAAALRAVAVPLAAEPETLEPALLWSAPLPAAGRAGSVVVAVAQSPGGGLVLTTWAGGDGGAAACGTQTPPGTADVRGLTVARVCALPVPEGGPGEDRWLVVTAPAAATSAEVVDGSGRLLATLPLADGGVVTSLPDGAATVLTRSGDGALLAETAVAPAAPEPFGDYGPGAPG